MLNFWMVRFSKNESEQIFGFPHIPTYHDTEQEVDTDPALHTYQGQHFPAVDPTHGRRRWMASSVEI